MKLSNLQDMTNGWFIGPFTPTILNTSLFECAVKHYSSGDRESSHIHKIATEYTVIVSGLVKMNGKTYGANSIIQISPGEETDFEALADTITVVVKIPASANDKYMVKSKND
ncbi:MAG: hypothetical protein K0R14_602 [Burkholderiales bacterium]|jgi:hypothetical protein|nr:hypothetical protein [Burkholderiales bacterium]